MKTTFKRWLIGIAVGVGGALLIAQHTRWIVLFQARELIPPLSNNVTLPQWGDPDLEAADRLQADLTAQRREADRHPDDFPMQLAAALRTSPSGKVPDVPTRLLQLRALEPRFADRPALYATLLRIACGNTVRTNRPEEDLQKFFKEGPSGKETRKATPSRPEDLALFDAEAAEGERLDPDNALFPLLRSVGLFGAGRDDEAIACFESAASKPLWKEYMQVEFDGISRLVESASGRQSATVRAALGYSLLYPHFAGLRGAARMMLYMAFKAERAGRPEEGLKLRLAVMHVGSMLRVQSRTAIGTLVGIAVAAIGTASPGGALPPATDNNLPPEQRALLRRANFLAYLQKIGHPEAASWAQSELQAGMEVKKMFQNDNIWRIYADVNALQHWWLADRILLANAAVFLLLAALAAYGARSRRLLTGVPFDATARCALLCAIPALLFLLYIEAQLSPTGIGLLLLGSLCLLALSARALRGAEERPDARRQQFWTRLVLTVSTLLVIQIVGRPTAAGVLELLQPLLAEHKWEMGSGMLKAVLTLGGLVTGFLAVLCALVALVVSLITRTPASVGMTRAFRGLGVPAACVVWVLYAGAVLGTARLESAAAYSTQRTVENEVAYLEELAGKKLPGDIRE